MDTITKILIARCGGEMRDGSIQPMENRLYAMIHLNEFEHKFGQPVMVNYKKENGEIDTIVAIGIKNGPGRDCYSIVSEGGILYVGGVVNDLVDVSSLIHGIPYVVWYEGRWCLATIEEEGNVNSVRVIGDLTTEDIIYNLSDGHRYYYKGGKLVREDSLTDFIQPQLDALQFGKLELEVSPRTPANGLCKAGESVTPEFSISVITESGEDVTGRCSYSVMAGSTPVRALYNNGVLYIQSEISDTTEYTITATYNLGDSEVSVTKKITVEFVTPILYGPEGDESHEALWNGRDPLVLYFNLEDSVSIVKIPSRYPEFDHIFDVHGLDYKEDYDVTLTSNYRIYRKLDAVTIHNFKQAFTYGSDTING